MTYLRILETDRWAVSYRGFLEDVVWCFPTKHRAMQWAAQVGHTKDALITRRGE